MRAIWLALMLGAAAVSAAADGIVARVDGTPITEAMVNAVVRAAISGRTQPPSSEEIAALSDAALESLIDLELLYAAAQRQGITVSDAQVDAEVARSRARFAGGADYEAALARSGMTAAQVRADTRKTLVVEALLERVVWQHVRVTPEAVQRYYDQHRDELGDKPFPQLRPAIERALRDEQRDAAQRAYLLELKKTAVILRGPPSTPVPTARPTRAPTAASQPS
jgi:parvulin-like peptidyl-prolyl isomerase